MPDAREMLKKLAKEKRHKRVDIKVPEESTRPAPLKKIKRSGPTRPYQLVEPDGTGSEGAQKAVKGSRKGAVAGPPADLPDAVDREADERSAAAVDLSRTVASEMAITELSEEKLPSTDKQEADSRLSHCKELEKRGASGEVAAFVEASNVDEPADPPRSEDGEAELADPNGAVADVFDAYTSAGLVHPKVRGGGRTVTDLAKRSLIQPDWQVDLTKEEGFLRAHFREFFGKGKMAKEVDLYCQLYAEARRRQTISLHFLSAALGELVGSTSNGTIRARLLSSEKLGLLIQQGFNNETSEHRRGTYIHLRCPWL